MPSICVRTNASGSAIDRSTCVSAAKFTTASAPSIASATAAGSSMAPWTNVVRGVAQVLAPAGIGQLVEDDHVVAVLGRAQAREVRADEARPAGDEQPHAAAAPVPACSAR